MTQLAQTEVMVEAGSERRRMLDRGVLMYSDIQDQPKGKFYVVVDISPVQSLLLYADRIDVTDSERGTVVLYRLVEERNGETVYDTVASFSSLIPWHSVAAEYASVVTTEQMARATSVDHKAMHELEKALRPQQGCEAAPEGIPTLGSPTGQYL